MMRRKMIRKISVLVAVVLTITAIPMSAGADVSRANSIDGSYILANGYTKYYAGLNASTPSQGTVVQQQSYAGTSKQFWTITKISGTDRYWIKNGDYCLGGGSGSTGVYMQICYGSSSTYGYQQWYLDPVEMIDGRFGRYKIRSADSSQSGKVLGVVGTGTNTNITLMNYVNDSYRADEWLLCPRDEAVITLDVGYDSGYAARFSNPATRILPYLQALQKKYITDFGIWVGYTYPHAMATLADDCNVGNYQFCACGTCVNSTSTNISTCHHTNIHNIMYDMTVPQAGVKVDMLFIGRHTCSAGDDNHDYELGCSVGGLTMSGRRMATIAQCGNSTLERKIAVHEFGHFKTHFTVRGSDGQSHYIGLDHYTEPGSAGDNASTFTTPELQAIFPNDGYSDYCIYGRESSDTNVKNNLTICGGCQKRIIECRSNYS